MRILLYCKNLDKITNSPPLERLRLLSCPLKKYQSQIKVAPIFCIPRILLFFKVSRPRSVKSLGENSNNHRSPATRRRCEVGAASRSDVCVVAQSGATRERMILVGEKMVLAT